MYCGHFKIHKRGKTIRGKEKYQRYFCDKCRKSFSELAGTIYEDRRLTPTDIDEILECQNQGMNFTQAAKKVGVTPKAVSKLLKATKQVVISQPTDSIQSVARQTPSIVTQIKCQIILLTVLFGISGCLTPTASNKRTASTSNPINTASAKSNSDLTLLAGKSKHDMDIYETKYSWGDRYCAD
jgi:transposase-like protein